MFRASVDRSGARAGGNGSENAGKRNTVVNVTAQAPEHKVWAALVSRDDGSGR